MKNIKLILEYDGTNYCGWQIQNEVPTVQGELEKAILNLTGEDVEVIGVSRTDRGVHALNYVCNFLTDSKIPPDRFYLALNTKLPNDIVCKSSELVDNEFHSRFLSKGKKYTYKIYNNFTASALLYNRAWHVREELNISAMEEAAKHYIGTHDYEAFRATGSNASSTIKTIFDTSVDIQGDYSSDGAIITFNVTGTAFLYNMVRIMTGTLVYVGLGKIAPCDIPKIIASRDRKNAGITAPPQGLYLNKVYY